MSHRTPRFHGTQFGNQFSKHIAENSSSFMEPRTCVLTNQELSRVLFADESRFNTNNCSHRIFIWRVPGTHYHLSNIREFDQFGGCRILFWAGILLDSHTPQHIFEAGSVNAQRCTDEVKDPHVKLL
ncbi:transposable element Tc1 transposase [Trichonephila clavipes]|nr:transposable element Tc1 transposase [Trichonephila clavipes]